MRAPRMAEATPGRSATQATAVSAGENVVFVGDPLQSVDHRPGVLGPPAVPGFVTAVGVLAEPDRAGGRWPRPYFPVS